MEQMLWNFCQNYALINNPQREVEARIHEFVTGVRNASTIGSAEKLQSSAQSPAAQPAFDSLSSPSSLLLPPSLAPIYSNTQPPHTDVLPTPAEPTHPSTTPPLPYCDTTMHSSAHSTIHLSCAASPRSPTFASVFQSRPEQSQSAPAVQNALADFTVVDRKKMRKVSTERNESKQKDLIGTGVNIDCICAPLGIA